jgi:hypothetical protein
MIWSQGWAGSAHTIRARAIFGERHQAWTAALIGGYARVPLR